MNTDTAKEHSLIIQYSNPLKMHNLLATFLKKKKKNAQKLFFEVHKHLRLKGQDHNAIALVYQILSHVCFSPRS